MSNADLRGDINQQLGSIDARLGNIEKAQELLFKKIEEKDNHMNQRMKVLETFKDCISGISIILSLIGGLIIAKVNKWI